MATCAICGQALADGARACAACGTAVTVAPPAAAVLSPPAADRPRTLVLSALAADQRYCPACERVYGPDYADTFCACGVELLTAPPPAQTSTPAPPARPPAGTPCLVLYGPDRQPVQFFPLTKDVTLIGRLDAVAGHFPDVDLDAWLDPAGARRVSRQHALVLRHRAAGTFTLRPLAGNTGTQLEAEMVLPLHDYPLPPGSRLVLGGAARLKFEVP